MKKVSKATLAFTAVLLAAALAIMHFCAVDAAAPDAAIMLLAEEKMLACSTHILHEKERLGIPPAEEDRFRTGLIGDPYTPITTTLGPIEAKRTAADSSMAALMVRMLQEAGVAAGDKVAAGFSGSFPGLNLAVICACEALDAEIVYICSVGASTYGANQPEMTFPDMACLLYEAGLIQTPPAAFSMGGDKDVGADMDPDACDAIRARLEEKGLPFICEPDYTKNLAARREIYEESGMPDCFIGVGGGIVTQGLGESDIEWGLTPAGTVRTTTPRSGLLEIYNSSDLPVISLLNIKKLTADYSLPYDPERNAAPGEAALYTRSKAPWPIAPAALILAGLLLWRDPFGKRAKKEGDSHEPA